MGKYLRPFPLLAAVTLVLLASETSAFAQRGYYGPGYRRPGYYTPYYGGQTHDGFYMRLDIGVGYLSASESYGGGTDYYSGAGLTYGAAFGGAIAPNLIIFGELFGTTVLDATYTYRGSSGPSGMDITMYAFGPGVAYYFEPINLYLSGSLAFTKMSFSDTGTGAAIDDTRLGFGLNFMVGKEWWVGREWGIGLAGQIHVATMGDYVQGYDTRMNAMTLSMLFSVTFN